MLVHGSGTGSANSFAALAPALQRAGYCVFAVDIGAAATLTEVMSGKSDAPGLGAVGSMLTGHSIYGVADISVMAEELARVVRSVQETTHRHQVALVGHSTGGTVIRAYLQTSARAPVSTVITLGSPFRGSTWDGLRAEYPDLAALGLTNAQIAAEIYGVPGRQQLPGSTFLNSLNADGETVPGVRYTAIASRTDEVITPNENALLAAPEGDDHNVWLQDGCPANTATHSSMLIDRRAVALVLAALAGTGANPAC
ncbi:esterase/lipase family protein [Nocardia brasiliensis]